VIHISNILSFFFLCSLFHIIFYLALSDELLRCALELHKKSFSLDVCLNMCSSAIRYACFCTSVYFFVPVFLCLFSLLFFCVFFCTTYILKFFYLVTSAYTFVICPLQINQSFYTDICDTAVFKYSVSPRISRQRAIDHGAWQR